MKTRLEKFANGSWPVMLTPFKEDRSIDWDGLDQMIEWYIGSNVTGLFAMCLSSQMFFLTWSERLAITEHIVKKVNNRVPIVASGVFGKTINIQAERITKMFDTGVDGIVCLTNQVVQRNKSEDIWLQNMEKLVGLTKDIPLGLYECPAPYTRRMSPTMTQWCVDTDRFYFLKDTCAVPSQIKAKLDITNGNHFNFMNANAATILYSLQEGADGYSGISGNHYPELYDWLCKNFDKDPETAKLLQRFITIAEPLCGKKLFSIREIFNAASRS